MPMRVLRGVFDAEFTVSLEHARTVQLVVKLEGLPLQIGVDIACAFDKNTVLLFARVHDQRCWNVCNLRNLINQKLPLGEGFSGNCRFAPCCVLFHL